MKSIKNLVFKPRIIGLKPQQQQLQGPNFPKVEGSEDLHKYAPFSSPASSVPNFLGSGGPTFGINTECKKMSQHILKIPVSLCSWSFSAKTTLFFSSKLLYSPQPSARWLNPQVHCPVRRFFAVKSRNIRPEKKKKRLDEICLERFEQYSRTFIQSWILQGKVFVDGKVVYKAGTPIPDKAVVEIKAEVPKYVCRAGHKLEAAIEQLKVDVVGKIALDSGLSTGGFTDCLLQYGASFVYGLDVGYGQVAEKIRQDERVCVIERTNLRYLSTLPQKVLPAVVNVMKEEATLVTLIKPQFEAHRSQVGRGGIVKDPSVHKEVISKIINGVESYGFRCNGWIESPLKGAEGNTEFLACFTRQGLKNADHSPGEEPKVDSG